MGILSSIITLGLVAGMGWFTIYYLIPKIEAGELDIVAPATAAETEPEASGETGEVDAVIDDMLETATGAGESTEKPAKLTKEYRYLGVKQKYGFY